MLLVSLDWGPLLSVSPKCKVINDVKPLTGHVNHLHGKQYLKLVDAFKDC